MKHSFFKIGLLALSMAALSGRAQLSSIGAPLAEADRCNFSTGRLGPRLVVADFNNDQKPDSITLRSLGQHGGKNAFSVHVCASGRTVSLLTFESTEPSIAVTSIDVNGDGSPDIIIEQRYTQKRIQVWLNDGHGGFRKAHTGDYRNQDTRAPCIASAPSKGRHNSPRRAHLVRGKKLSIERAELPTTCGFSPQRYRGSLTVRVQRHLGGPNLSRAPPIALHL